MPILEQGELHLFLYRGKILSRFETGLCPGGVSLGSLPSLAEPSLFPSPIPAAGQGSLG